MEDYTFVKANASVSFYTAKEQTTADTNTHTRPLSKEPALIVLLPWMGATKRQTESYIRGHITLFTDQRCAVKGLGVAEMEMFENTSHVRHAVEDQDRYWGAIARL
ncbi:hypothetical protein BJX64DRAFT_291021 [Aspergillus heterothallicus]